MELGKTVYMDARVQGVGIENDTVFFAITKLVDNAIWNSLHKLIWSPVVDSVNIEINGIR